MSAGPAVHRTPVRRPVAPRGPRRVSGPARPTARTQARPAASPRRRPVAAAGVAAPRPILLPSPGARALDAARRMPESRWLDRIIRGRTWIVLIAAALIGIVFLQVSLLKMNSGIGQAVEHSTNLERQNAALRADVSRLSSEPRIQEVATGLGMVMPAAGDIKYLKASANDPQNAARTMSPPNAAAELAAIQQGPASTTTTSTAAGTSLQQPAPTAAPDPPAASAPTTTTSAPAPTGATTAQTTQQPVTPTPSQSQPPPVGTPSSAAAASGGLAAGTGN